MLFYSYLQNVTGCIDAQNYGDYYYCYLYICFKKNKTKLMPPEQRREPPTRNPTLHQKPTQLPPV